MTDEADFLTAIIANPDDDLPRLAFADWLDEHDEPDRAEFIRVQCELAVLCVKCISGKTGYWCANCTALRRRERELMTYDNCPAWANLPAEFDRDETGCVLPIARFHRGFVSEIGCEWADWREYAGELLKACPIVRVDRAPRRKCPYCSGEGCANHGHGDQTRFCDGSGTLPAETPDWRGDGLVRLADMPPFVADDSGPAVLLGNDGFVTVNLQRVGRRRVALSVDRVFDGRDVVLSILEDKWKGVKFELPKERNP